MADRPTAPDDRWARAASDDAADWPVGRLLSSAARRVEREWNTHLAAWDLNHASIPVLIHLLRRSRSQRELASVNGVTEQTMSRVLARLARTGYITRVPDETDHRRYVISITDAGRSVAVVAADPEAAEAMTTRGLTQEQVDQLRGLLAIVALEHEDRRETSADAPAQGSAATDQSGVPG